MIKWFIQVKFFLREYGKDKGCCIELFEEFLVQRGEIEDLYNVLSMQVSFLYLVVLVMSLEIIVYIGKQCEVYVGEVDFI